VKNKITVVGSGYVGMSMAILLAQSNDVVVLDIDKDRVEKINNQKSTISDSLIEEYIETKKLSLRATLNHKEAYEDSNFIIIATSTDYNVETNYFNTSSVDSTVKDVIKNNSDALIIIKSTLPLGHTDKLQKENKTDRIIFSPEFLREGDALKDNLYPSRIVIGGKSRKTRDFAQLLRKAALKENIEVLFMSSTEAESVKLFANSYLAMRVAFFNELDSFAMVSNLNSENIIDGVCSDKRIGNLHNNPSFGYGGYCLPKDTKQLLMHFQDDIPGDIVRAIVNSNTSRKNFIANLVIKRNVKTVGIYRLVMKAGSDNFRSSAVLDIMDELSSKGVEIILFEPFYSDEKFHSHSVIRDLDQFISRSELILANRNSNSLNKVRSKVITRDIYGEN